MLRAAVQGGRYPDGQLPSEAALMASHGSTRAAVREVLATLRSEGLIERTQGIGTHAVVRQVSARLMEAHGATAPTPDSMFNRRTRPHVLDRSELPAPASVADRLGVPIGTPCLRLEYVAIYEDEPMGVATNYVLFPEAARLRDCPFVTDWYALMADAGVELGESTFVIGCEVAEPLIAEVLGVSVGAPTFAIEQVIADLDGRLFDLAYGHMRADRFRLVSHGLPTSRSDT
jgi:GntR family transcriptional regulator